MAPSLDVCMYRTTAQATTSSPLRSPHILPLLQATAPHTVYCPGNPFRRPRWSLRPRRERRLRGRSRGRRRMRRRRRQLPARRRRRRCGRCPDGQPCIACIHRRYPPPCIAGIHRRYLIRTPSPRSRVSSGGISSTRTPPAHVLPPHTSAETPVRIGERDSRITQSAIGQNHSENRAACPLICEVTLRTCSMHNRTEVNGHPRSRVHTESGSVLFCTRIHGTPLPRQHCPLLGWPHKRVLRVARYPHTGSSAALAHPSLVQPPATHVCRRLHAAAGRA